MERNLTLITERHLTRAFSRLPGAKWELHWEYVIPAFLANRFPGLFGPINRLLARTPLRRRSFNLTFRVWKPPRRSRRTGAGEP
ncbi:MAG TPA: hypothetical protein VM031_02455 [Phycisphaerae bacterium]|nr:hypothetical protein [Phycisphaerae bacterium]